MKRTIWGIVKSLMFLTIGFPIFMIGLFQLIGGEKYPSIFAWYDAEEERIEDILFKEV